MKKRSSQWTSALCLFFALILLLSACSPQSGVSSSASTTAASGTTAANTTTAASTTTAAGTADQSSTAPEKIKIHSLKLMGKSPDNDIIKWDKKDEFPGWQLFVEELAKRNIELDYEVIMPDQYSVVLQTRFAAKKDLPDILYMGNMDDSSALALANNGLLVDLTAAIAQYSDGTIQAQRERLWPFDGKINTAPDGKCYWFTNTQNLQYVQPGKTKDEAIPAPYVIGNAIRVDWLEKYGLEMPATLEEYHTALKTFRENDANGNGKQDEILMYDPYSYNFFNGIAQWFGLAPSLAAVPVNVDVANGEAVTPWYQPGVQEYFRFMNQLVKDGIFDLSLVGATDEQCNQKIAENKVSSLRSYSTGNVWEEMINADPDAPEMYQLVPPIEAVEGVTPYVLFEPSQMAWDKYGITTACEDVEGAIKFFDFVYSDEGSKIISSGVEGVDYKQMDSEDDPNSAYYLAADGEFYHVPATDDKPAMSAQEKWDNRRGITAQNFIRGNFIPRLQAGYTYFTSTDRRNSIKMGVQIELMQYPYFYPSQPGTYYAVATDEENAVLEKYAAALMTASEELSMKLILGQKSLDDWESHIATLKAFGLDEVLAVYQGRHARWQGTN